MTVVSVFTACVLLLDGAASCTTSVTETLFLQTVSFNELRVTEVLETSLSEHDSSQLLTRQDTSPLLGQERFPKLGC